MKTGTTLLLLAAAGALTAWVILGDPPGTRDQAWQQVRALDFDPEKIDRITIRNGEETVELELDGADWRMTAPVKDKAETPFIRQIIGVSHELVKEEVIPGNDKEKLKSFGLDKSRLRLELRGKGQKPPELLFGAETPVEGKTYVRHKDSEEVFVVDARLRGYVSSKADDFRQRRLFDLEAAHLYEITLETKAGKMVLVRDGAEWELRQPLKSRVNEAFLGELLHHLLATEVMTFIRDKGANLSAVGLAEPRATLTLKSHSSEEPVQLQIGTRIASGQEEVPDALYTRLSTRESIALVPYGVERLVTLTPDELRDRHLIRLQSDMIDRIHLEATGRPAMSFHRQVEGWSIGKTERKVDERKVLALIQAVEATPVTAFVSNVASNLEAYGLDQPRMKITFASYASATTAETGAGELPIATLLFGREENGQIYAKVEDEPFIVTLPAAILRVLDRDPVEWRGPTVFDFQPAEIVSLDLAYPKVEGHPRPSLSLTRDGEKWKSAREGTPTLDQTRVESVVNTLASLVALDWIAPVDLPADASQHLSFQIKDGPKISMKIARATLDDGRAIPVGQIEGEPGLFILSEPDYSALKLQLTEATLPGETP